MFGVRNIDINEKYFDILAIRLWKREKAMLNVRVVLSDNLKYAKCLAKEKQLEKIRKLHLHDISF